MKKRFVETVAPLIEQENTRVTGQRQRLLTLLERLHSGLSLSAEQRQWLGDLATSYGLSGDPLTDATARTTLQRRVDIIPVKLALAQAALESGWGRSRFSREGNNLFGIWTRDPEQGLKPKQREPGRSHLVRRYPNLRESVRHYLHLLNTHREYADLRQRRATARARDEEPSGTDLAAGLSGYSAEGEKYVQTLRRIMADSALRATSRTPAQLALEN